MSCSLMLDARSEHVTGFDNESLPATGFAALLVSASSLCLNMHYSLRYIIMIIALASHCASMYVRQ